MLLTLLVFHVYWGKLIFLMIMKQLNNKGKVGEDVRSGKVLFLCCNHLFDLHSPFFTLTDVFFYELTDGIRISTYFFFL